MKFELDDYHRNTPLEVLLDDIRRVAKGLNKNTISASDYDKIGNYGKTTILRKFGTWNNALSEAKLDIGLVLNIPNEDLFRNLENVWISLGRQPKYAEMRSTEVSKYSLSTYEKRFGSWRKALEEFVLFINDEDESDNESKIDSQIYEPLLKSNSLIHKTKRDISERLRFKILLRDGFTCKKCGRSPLKEFGVELHVDHILPWSKGGETVPENLETKCKECNLGKGNAFNV